MFKLNLGCADLPMPKPWLNIDIYSDGKVKPDLVMDVRELDDHFAEDSVDEIYAAHLVEHLTPKEADDCVRRWVKVLKPGGVLTLVTPDVRVIFQNYLDGEEGYDLDRLIDVYIFSYCQVSHHASMWDVQALTSLMQRHGLADVSEIDRMEDERLAYGAEWQCGVTARKS